MLTGADLRDPDALAANIRHWLGRARLPDDGRFYAVAHRTAAGLALINGTTVATVAYVLAALSAGNAWPRNVADAALILASPDGSHRPCTYGRPAQLARDVAAGRAAPDFNTLGPKTKPFGLTIANPDDRNVQPVIDRHAWSLAAGLPPDRRTDAPYLTDARRDAAQSAYRAVAAETLRPAHVVQAATWAAYRRAAGLQA